MSTTHTDRSAVLESEVHVWLLRPDTVSDAAARGEYAALLDAEEHARYRRLRFASDRHRFLVAHGLLRRALSHYAPVDPAAWRFERGAHGRPEIEMPRLPVRLRFNLSHTAGLVACAVTLDAACGIDVERLAARRHLTGIADRFFAEPERRDLRTLEGTPEHLGRFFTYWTLREAWCKALGTGLAHAHGNVWFEVNDESAVTLRGTDDTGNATANWQCVVLRPTATHRLALVVRRTGALDRIVRYRYLGA